ncbi:hypothetical protein, partial [Erwinia amylovora]|uniref:hypothetical protein n=1 Tax=Erwinia amylovora TaxID=552 RepID=UPI001A905117
MITPGCIPPILQIVHVTISIIVVVRQRQRHFTHPVVVKKVQPSMDARKRKPRMPAGFRYASITFRLTEYVSAAGNFSLSSSR